MKRIFIILLAVVSFGVEAALAQNISPMELKNARLAVYEWFDKYQSYDMFDAEIISSRRFCSLFADSSVNVVNDYLPCENYNFENPMLPLNSYVDLVRANRNGFYKCYFKIIDVGVVSEKIAGRVLKYELDYKKVVWFKDTSYNHYEYPKDTLRCRVNIEYDIVSLQANATLIKLNEPIKEFVVLHKNDSNAYTTLQHLKRDSTLLSSFNTPILNYEYKSCYFDSKMYELQCDTTKWAMYVGGNVGLGYGGIIVNNLYSDLRHKSKINYSVGIGLYRQIILKTNNRLGIEFGFSLRQTNLNIYNIYGDRFSSIDTDGGCYERIIAVTDYEEDLTRFAAGLPVVLRYDHFMMAGQRKRLALSAKLGVLPKYDFKQVSRATADAQYSGYYDWLWGVTIDQNDIYDFGSYAIDNKYEKTSIDKFSFDTFAALGVSYYVTRKVSIDLSAAYYGTLYNKVNYTYDSHLTNDLCDWHSASFLMRKYSLHSINLILQMNYNF